MNNRLTRYHSFDSFSKNAEVTFKTYSETSNKSQRLKDLYSFYVTPGGRFGGRDKKVVDIFYGNRPFDTHEEIGTNSKVLKKFDVAHGAILSYQRTDDGRVLCSLYPASSENYHSPETFILLGIIDNPSKLKCKTKLHWLFFEAYMESTCLDGSPSFLQKVLIFYLRNFKECVIDKTLQKRKAVVFLKDICKYTVTVGLSGFIFFLFTLARDSADKNQLVEINRQALNFYSNIADNTRITAQSSIKIEKKMLLLEPIINENQEKITSSITENTSKIEKAIASLKEKNIIENDNFQEPSSR